MKPKEIFLRALKRESVPRPAAGSATSVITVDLMEKVGVYFPDAHLDAEKMAALAGAGYTELGFDNVMPLFSVWHESSALGCSVDWGEMGR
ncbi:MAG: MtaA/CmuA family methyltransferase, partial [Candidatus Latescibacteria bacterium]|nr:MtaA/CmuA family methyltransferase [Candidatus Latescibacterota bacterium]